MLDDMLEKHRRVLDKDVTEARYGAIFAVLQEMAPSVALLPRNIRDQVLEACDFCYQMGQVFGMDMPSDNALILMCQQAEKQLNDMDNEA